MVLLFQIHSAPAVLSSQYRVCSYSAWRLHILPNFHPVRNLSAKNNIFRFAISQSDNGNSILPLSRLIPPRISICVFSRAEAACAAEQCCRHNIQPVLISFFITFTPLPFEYDICLFFLLLLIPVMLDHWTDVLTQFLTE